MVATAAKTSKTTLENDDLEGWLTFEQSQMITGVSRPTLQKWIEEGKIRTERARRYGNHHVRVILHPGDVAKCQRPNDKSQRLISDADEFAARVFEFLDAGRSVREIVVLARAQPSRIEDLRQQWMDAGAADMIITMKAHAELVRFLGPFQTVVELVERAREVAGHTIEIDVPDSMSRMPEAKIEARIVEALDQATTP